VPGCPLDPGNSTFWLSLLETLAMLTTLPSYVTARQLDEPKDGMPSPRVGCPPRSSRASPFSCALANMDQLAQAVAIDGFGELAETPRIDSSAVASPGRTSNAASTRRAHRGRPRAHADLSVLISQQSCCGDGVRLLLIGSAAAHRLCTVRT